MNRENILNNFKYKYGINPYEFFLNKDNYINLNDNDYERIKDELINLKSDVVCELYIIKMIHDYLVNNNQYFLPRGTISNSFILFKLGVTNVNLDRYNLPKEVLYGLNNDKTFSIDINVAKSFKEKIVSFIKDTFKDDLYYKMSLDKNGNLQFLNDSKFLVNLDDNIDYNIITNNGNKYIEEACYKLMETHNFVSINILELQSLEDLNELREKCGEINYNIFNDEKIIDAFLISQNNSGVDREVSLSEFDFEDALFNGCDPLLTLARVISAVHSTDVLWNAKKRGTHWNYIDTLKYPLSRDEIMIKCLNWIYDRDEAYNVMDYVRRGKVNRSITKERYNEWLKIKEKLIDSFDQDYADYLEEIEYIFPLGYALEYTMYYFQLMYYKVYYYDEFFKIRTRNYQDYINLDEGSLYELKEKFINDRDFESSVIIDLLIEKSFKNDN